MTFCRLCYYFTAVKYLVKPLLIMLPFDHLRKLNTRDNLWLYILWLLEKKEFLYGWEIPSFIEKEFSFKPGKITPYRVLYRLEKGGFVKSKKVNRRRIYTITEKGEEELKKGKFFYKMMVEKIS